MMTTNRATTHVTARDERALIVLFGGGSGPV